jgi:hypothetical protein
MVTGTFEGVLESRLGAGYGRVRYCRIDDSRALLERR